jgi:TRAP-type C4-dicarboxylate transport system substrate-binding protein
MTFRFPGPAAILSTFAATAILAAVASDRVAAQSPIVLRGITPWVADYDLSKSFFIFQELVNKSDKLKGKLVVSYLGGPEIAAPNDQVTALKNGVVDVILGAAAYYRTDVPLAAAVQFTSKLPTELRKSGYYDLMRKIHADAGVVYLANTAGGNKFRMYIKKPLEKPDFTGLRFRVSPVYTPLVEALGGTAVHMSPGDVYTALERGIVDGFGWTYTGIDIWGWQEVSKYVINHPFYSLDGAILINANVWNKLPADVKAALEEIGVELEGKVQEFIQSKLNKEDERLAKLGMKFITFSEADAKKYVNTAYNAGWADFLAKNKAAIAAKPGLAKQLQELGN